MKRPPAFGQGKAADFGLADVEQIIPGETARRRQQLERVRAALLTSGYNPFPISRNDLECLWVRLQHGDQLIHFEYEDEVALILQAHGLPPVLKPDGGDT